MSGDFSRDTSEPAHLARFTQVLIEQGRPLLDSDFNEQSAIHHDFLRTLIVDLMGRGWRPASGSFVLQAAGAKDVVKISKGHFYVDGILCDNPRDCAYSAQPFLSDLKPTKDDAIYYVECWERHVSAIQRPELREIALGGADTSSRAQIVWQVRVATADWAKAQASQVNKVLATRMAAAVAAKDTEEAAALEDLGDSKSKMFLDTLTKDFTDAIGVASLPTDFDARSFRWFDALMAVPPRLRAQAKLDATDNEACSIAPDARYRGRENQLYRVEVHKGGTLADGPTDGPTFKWSRDNGSALFAVPTADGAVIKVSAPDSAGMVTLTVPLQTLGHDRRTGICVGDWVELTSDAFDLDALALPLGQVKQVDRTRRSVNVQVDGADDDALSSIAKCTVLRRWDQSENLDAKVKGTVAITEAITETDWIPLERGVQIQFQPGAVYRARDYWLIPARVASQNVVWPQRDKKALFVAPSGIARHRAVIGVALTPSTGPSTGTWTALSAGRVAP